MEKRWDSLFPRILLGILIVQFLTGLFYINYPFFDGRLHYNWGPAFWLLQAEKINHVGLQATYWGTKDYPAHPQLIGPVIALWTRTAGYSEGSIRTLSLLLTVLVTVFLTLAIKRFMGSKKALAFSLIFASLPLVYIYGKKLDQEALVLLFLAIYLYGISKITFSEKKGYLISAMGVLGMALSDWSGLVFTAFIATASIFAWSGRENKERIIKFFLISFVVSVFGLLLFLTQSYLQAGSPGFAKFFQNYYELWRFRAGVSTNISWWGWLTAQFNFLSVNYSVPLGLVAFVVLARVFRSKVDTNIKTICIFILAILLGELFYMVLLRQASGVHVYYQYFLSIPIAFGLLLLIDEITNLFKNFSEKEKKQTWLVVFSILCIGLMSYTTYQYNDLLFHSSGTDLTDIELMSYIKTIPLDKGIIVAEINNMAISWYQNPNIIYYSGRENIPTYLLEDGVPFADYQLVPSSQAKAYAQAIDGGGYDQKITATIVKCSVNICLLNLKKG